MIIGTKLTQKTKKKKKNQNALYRVLIKSKFHNKIFQAKNFTIYIWEALSKVARAMYQRFPVSAARCRQGQNYIILVQCSPLYRSKQYQPSVLTLNVVTQYLSLIRNRDKNKTKKSIKRNRNNTGLTSLSNIENDLFFLI